ncbi:MAG: YdcF family protein [Acutalibacteraceae bacterium]
MSDLPITHNNDGRAVSEIPARTFSPHSPKRTVRPVFFAFVLAVSLVVVCLIATAFSIVSYSQIDEARPADAAVVLGAAAPNGKVSPVYRERLNHAVSLYQSGLVRYILVTGGTADGNIVSDALTAKDYVVSQGVPESDILVEDQSTITEENLEYSKTILDERGLSSVLIVSDPLHMKRAMLMADDYGLNAYSSPTPTSMYRSVKTKLPFLLREEFFYIGYRIVRFFRQ